MIGQGTQCCHRVMRGFVALRVERCFRERARNSTILGVEKSVTF
jgi:ribosomal protein S14